MILSTQKTFLPFDDRDISRLGLQQEEGPCLARRPRLKSPNNRSWLNQLEIVFGIVGRRVVRRGNFVSLVALTERMLQFIDYFNRTFAQPFRWTYSGRPTTAETVKRPATWKESWASRRENSETLAIVG